MEKPNWFELPAEAQAALLALLVEQGLLDEQGRVTALGEQYITSMVEEHKDAHLTDASGGMNWSDLDAF